MTEKTLANVLGVRPVKLVALRRADDGAAGLVPIKTVPVFDAKPEDWNFGHPAGALFMREVEFSNKATELGAIDGWAVRDKSGKELARFASGNSTVLEPGVDIRLSRAVLIPHGAFS